MHTLDSLARSLARPVPARRPPRRHGAPILAGLISLACALAPLAVMTHVYMGAV